MKGNSVHTIFNILLLEKEIYLYVLKEILFINIYII